MKALGVARARLQRHFESITMPLSFQRRLNIHYGPQHCYNFDENSSAVKVFDMLSGAQRCKREHDVVLTTLSVVLGWMATTLSKRVCRKTSLIRHSPGFEYVAEHQN